MSVVEKGQPNHAEPLVSIIVPVYNVDRYLRSCLDSVLMQTYRRFEVILVDDGSSDASPKICEEYVGRDGRFRVIHQENQGLASARNTGLRNYKGDYFYFLDSDDCIHPQLLETAVGIAEREKAALVQVNLKEVPADFEMGQAWPETDAAKAEIWGKDLQRFSLAQALYNLDLDNQKFAKDIRLTTTVVWTKLYRSAVFRDFLFPEGMRMHEDQMVAHRLIQMGGGMVFLDAPLYFYRKSEASLIRVGWTPKRLAILDCYEDRLKCCEEVLEESRAGALQDDTARYESLKDYIFLRYLVCCFRNYDMADQHMEGAEKNAEKKKILVRIKELMASGRGNLPAKKKLFFKLFLALPMPVIRIFQLRNRLKHR